MEQLKTMNVAGFTVEYRPGTSDEEVIRDTLTRNVFFKGFPEYKPKDHHVVLDIGAHIGAYTIQLSSLLKSGKVYAFEPCLDTFTLLENNVRLNNFSNAEVHKVALTDYIGTTKLFYDIQHGNWGHSIVKSFSDSGEIVETDTLSNFFTKHGIESCDFIKFNCEGAEFKIILSTPVEVLKKVNNMLVLYHMDLTDEFTVDQLIDHLKKAGFYTEIRHIEDEGKRGWLIVMRIGAGQRFIMKTRYTLRPLGHFSGRVVNKLKRMAGLK